MSGSPATTLHVEMPDRRVGTLVAEEHEYLFRYEDVDALDPDRHLVSLTMPVRHRGYETQVLHPPFQVSLPEGALLETLHRQFGKVVNLHEDVNLLMLVGGHTIGRLRFRRADREAAAGPAAPAFDLDHLLRHPEARALFDDLIERNVERSAVAGVQPKTLWSELKPRSQPTVTTDAFIVKAAGRDYPGLPVNEYLCLEASRAAEIPTCDATLSDNADLLAIARFDRVDDGAGGIRQLAFEEACSLLRRTRHGKYDASYEQLVQLVQQIPCTPLQESLEDLYASIVLSLVLRNGDAHLKNFGVLYDTARAVWLAPTYDIVTTTVYIANDVPALTLGDRKAWPDREALMRLGLDACGLRRRTVSRILARIEGAVVATKPRIRELGDRFPVHRELLTRIERAWDAGLLALLGR